ncbi:MAG: hypothetical protein WD688_25250 [Candidatus Binatia bacterium]
MRSNPVLRESIDIFFVEGHGFAVYFYMLMIIAPVEFLSLYLPSLDAQMWSGSASLFKVTAVTVLLLTVYFALRVANQEFASWKFQSLRSWTRDRGQSIAAIGRAQLSFLSLHVGLSVLLCAPFLIWAAAIARTPIFTVAITFLLLLFYALGYGVWGLFALVQWERRAESRQVFIRCFFFTLIILSLLLYLPLNPLAFVLAILARQELAPLTIAGSKWSATAVHLTGHLLLGGMALIAHRWALRRELTT